MPISAESPIFGLFDIVNMKQQNRQTFDANQNDKFEHLFHLHCEFYNEGVMIEGKKVPNKIIIKLDEINLYYQQENVFRIKDYFFNQFLDALTGDATPEEVGEKWYLKRDSEVKSTDFKEIDLAELGYTRKSGLIQHDEKEDELHQGTIVEIFLNRPKIYLKDRPHFDEAI
jgi:hypothetical protein